MDKGPFVFAKKRGCGGIVMNKEIGNEGYDDCEEALLDIYQLSYPHCPVDGHTKIKIHLQPFSPPTPAINPIP